MLIESISSDFISFKVGTSSQPSSMSFGITLFKAPFPTKPSIDTQSDSRPKRRVLCPNDLWVNSHMNNNSLSGQFPHELSTLPNLVHMLLDNNNLSGHLLRELANLPSLLIL
ncbi:putative LRR receptor-like serine/threonine-protein kinase [Camellia lanceoleosa]|nr:putative LRR receptor-like serine/threonine-protein kinase [Camellia lanceoleosa]